VGDKNTIARMTHVPVGGTQLMEDRMKTIICSALLSLLLAGSLFADDWSRNVISDYISGPTDVVAADIDNDGDQDLVVSSRYLGALVWFNNQGDGVFTPQLISWGMFNIADIHVADLDGDSNLDVVYTRNDAPGYDDQAGGFYNLGSGEYWYSFTICPNLAFLSNACEIAALDFEPDGLLDVTISDDVGLHLFANNGMNQAWTHTGYFSHNYSDVPVATADMNNDGVIDIVGSVRNNLSVILVQDLFWPIRTVSAGYESPTALVIGDLNGDGLADIVAAGDDGERPGKIAIFINLGDATSWDRINLTQGFHIVSDLDLKDMDGDGDLDIIGAAFGDHELAWWENDGELGFTKHVLTINLREAISVVAINLDFDDELEIAALSADDDMLAFWDANTAQYDLTVTLTPDGEPLVVPQGGSFSFDTNVNATMPHDLDSRFWAYTLLTTGIEHNLLKTQLLFPGAGEIALNGSVVNVPAAAAPGNYQFVLGVDIEGEYQSAAFPFTVVESGRTISNLMQEWGMENFDILDPAQMISEDQAIAIDLPLAWGLNAAYPNPFNPSTTISVSLPETSDLTVSVFNVNGQQVAELANGQFNAGQHNLTFDASNLASGLYFIQAYVPGQLNATQKVMLVR
jgi:Secretion system C-terminal sorting domain/FG-GAP-like repeat